MLFITTLMVKTINLLFTTMEESINQSKFATKWDFLKVLIQTASAILAKVIKSARLEEKCA